MQAKVPRPGAPGHHHNLPNRQHGKGVVRNEDGAKEPPVQREVRLSLVHTWPLGLSLLPEVPGFARHVGIRFMICPDSLHVELRLLVLPSH